MSGEANPKTRLHCGYRTARGFHVRPSPAPVFRRLPPEARALSPACGQVHARPRTRRDALSPPSRPIRTSASRRLRWTAHHRAAVDDPHRGRRPAGLWTSLVISLRAPFAKPADFRRFQQVRSDADFGVDKCSDIGGAVPLMGCCLPARAHPQRGLRACGPSGCTAVGCAKRVRRRRTYAQTVSRACTHRRLTATSSRDAHCG